MIGLAAAEAVFGHESVLYCIYMYVCMYVLYSTDYQLYVIHTASLNSRQLLITITPQVSIVGEVRFPSIRSRSHSRSHSHSHLASLCPILSRPRLSVLSVSHFTSQFTGWFLVPILGFGFSFVASRLKVWTLVAWYDFLEASS